MSPIVDTPQKSDSTKVRLQLHLPEPVVMQYEDQARRDKVTCEKEMEDRLRRCVSHTATRGLYFNDAQRSELEKMTGGHFIDSPEQALSRIRNVVKVRVGNVTVELNQQVLDRAASRAAAFRMPVEKWLEKEIIEGMERATGLRP
jgi:hypothetical protein